MSTLEKIKAHAEQIMQNGGPKDQEEIKVLQIFNQLTGGKAFNAGKRSKKNHNKNW